LGRIRCDRPGDRHGLFLELRTETGLTQADVSGWIVTDASMSPRNGADLSNIQ